MDEKLVEVVMEAIRMTPWNSDGTTRSQARAAIQAMIDAGWKSPLTKGKKP